MCRNYVDLAFCLKQHLYRLAKARGLVAGVLMAENSTIQAASNEAWSGELSTLVQLYRKHIKKPGQIAPYEKLDRKKLKKHAFLLADLHNLKDSMNFKKLDVINALLEVAEDFKNFGEAAKRDFASDTQKRLHQMCRDSRQAMTSGRGWLSEFPFPRDVGGCGEGTAADEQGDAQPDEEGGEEEEPADASEEESEEKGKLESKPVAPTANGAARLKVWPKKVLEKLNVTEIAKGLIYYDRELGSAVRKVGEKTTHVVAKDALYVDLKISDKFVLAKWPDGLVSPLSNYRITEFQAAQPEDGDPPTVDGQQKSRKKSKEQNAETDNPPRKSKSKKKKGRNRMRRLTTHQRRASPRKKRGD